MGKQNEKAPRHIISEKVEKNMTGYDKIVSTMREYASPTKTTVPDVQTQSMYIIYIPTVVLLRNQGRISRS